MGTFLGAHGLAPGAPSKEFWNVFFPDRQRRACDDPYYLGIDRCPCHHSGERVGPLEDSTGFPRICPGDLSPFGKRAIFEGLGAL